MTFQKFPVEKEILKHPGKYYALSKHLIIVPKSAEFVGLVSILLYFLHLFIYLVLIFLR